MTLLTPKTRTSSCLAIATDEGAQAQEYNPALHGDALTVFLSDNPRDCPKCTHSIEDHGRPHLRYESLPNQDKVSNCSECSCFLVWDLTRLQFVN